VPRGLFAELRDGSVVFGREHVDNRRAMPHFARRPQALKELANLAGIWGADTPRLPPAGKHKGTVLWLEDQKRWQEITSVRFLEEVILWKVGERPDSHGYRKLPPLWLSAPAAAPAVGTWRLRTAQGDDLVLAGPETISGRLSREVTAMWQGQPVRIGAAEIGSIYRVEKTK
jgi:hypothetical protein